MIETLKIGVAEYTIKSIENLHDSDPEGKWRWLYGKVSHDVQVIKVDSSNHHDNQVITLWHEALHGVLHQAGVADDEHPESIIVAISHGIVQMLRDNPELVSFTLSEPQAKG